jgi:hypothetical protein
VTGVFYVTRENVMDALDVKASAYQTSFIDRAIDSASRNVEALTHRIFYPLLTTKSWPYPNSQNQSWTLWLDGNDLASLTTLTSGGATIPAAGYYLEPQEYGPPYNRIEINRGSAYAFAGGSSGPQRSISATGVFCGAPLDESDEGTLVAAIASTSTTTVTASKPIGVGRILRVDTERMIVTEKSFITSGQTVLTPLTASMANQTVAVTDGTQFAARESLLIDAERVLVLDVVGNNLTVKRAAQGTTLAAHTGSTIYWARSLTVTRGALGTTAATHLISAPVYGHVIPSLIDQLTTAYVLERELQESSGYARTGRDVPGGRGITDLEARVIAAHGRQARQRAV